MRSIYLYLMMMVFAVGSLKAETITVTPGKLPSLVRTLPEGETAVTLSGECNAEDLAALKYIPRSVRTVDMVGLQIKENIIPAHTFLKSDIKKITLPASLEEIGEGAFAESGLETVTLPASLSHLGARAFYRCAGLTALEASGSSIFAIPEECFFGCEALKTLSLPASLSIIEDRAFMRSGLENVAVPMVNRIGSYAFAEIPTLTTLTLKQEVVLGEGAFFNDPLIAAIDAFPSDSPVLGFAGSNVFPIVLKAEIIEAGAFASADVNVIRLGAAVREIKSHAFSNVRNLVTVNAMAKGDEIPLLDEQAFSGVDVSKVKLLIAAPDEEGWKSAPGWKEFDIVNNYLGVDDIGDNPEALRIESNDGVMAVSSGLPMDKVTLYSLGGILLFESASPGTELTAGPFGEKEVVICVYINEKKIVKKLLI